MNVLQIIKQIASREDFVSFKLDIDAPTIEISIALEIASNTSHWADLIDEFFFELHFRCPLMAYCGWGSNIGYEYDGLVLDRIHAMELFLKMRRNGIRSHFWP